MNRASRRTVTLLLTVALSVTVGPAHSQKSRKQPPEAPPLVEAGDPEFEYEGPDGTRYIVVHLDSGSAVKRNPRRQDLGPCSAIYTVGGDGTVSSRLYGPCRGNGNGTTRGKRLFASLEGRFVKDVVMALGAPETAELSDGTGTMFYDTRQSSSTSGPIPITDGLSLGFSIRIGCAVTFAVANHQVAAVEYKGRVCPVWVPKSVKQAENRAAARRYR